MKQIPSMTKDLNNKANFLEPPDKYSIGDTLKFRNSDSRELIGEVTIPFTKSEFGWLLRVMVKNDINEYERDIYYNEIIK